MKQITTCLATVAVASLLAVAGTANAATASLIFSEHVEGSSFNKALEIYNSGSTAVDLSTYSVELYSNGNTTATSTQALSGTLAAGDVFVIANSQADPAILAVADVTSGVADFNGDDVLLLKSSTGIVDSFGTLGTDPGSSWGSGAFTSKDHTLQRKDSICAGDTNPNDAFDPATQWDSLAKDTFGGLGSHTVSCSGGVNSITVSIADVSQAEGNSGSSNFVFTVALSRPAAAGGVNFDIATGDGTATTADSDYVANSVTSASIAAGSSSYSFTVQVTGDTTPEPDEGFGVTLSNIQGTDVITTSASATGTIVNDDIATLEVYEIQGSGSASPWAGQTVNTSGVVTAVEGSGFYLQTPDSAADSDPLTSNGIYVYEPSSGLSPGDVVTLTAGVSEYYGLTELSGVSNLVVISSGQTLPTAVAFDDHTPSTDPTALTCGSSNFECFEGMRVHIANGMATTGSGYSSNFTYDYLYVTATGERSMREPGLLYGLTPTAGDNGAADVWDGNPEGFTMSPNEFSASVTGYDGNSTPITGGSRFTATGVFGYSFGAYEFYPTALNITYAAPMPDGVPLAGSGILRIGSFNAERFCDAVDDTIPIPPPGEAIPPGKEIFECGNYGLPTTAEYQEKTERVADYIGTVLGLPDVVALEEVENLGALTKLADQLNADYGISYTPRLIEGNGVSGIDVAFLVNPATVQIVSVVQLDKYLKWLTPNGNNRPVFDRPPLLLQAIYTGAGMSQPFMVLANHLKSRSDVDDVTSTGEPTADALEAQEKRFRQAYALAMLVDNLQSPYAAQTLALRQAAAGLQRASSLQAEPAGIPLAVVGDFNAYEFTDGFVDMVGLVSGHYDFAANIWDLSDLTSWNLETLGTPLADTNVVNPPLWNAVLSLPENERYSYLYTVRFGSIQGYDDSGQSDGREVPTDQVLDHALLNQAAKASFVRMDYGRANQDAASQTEYNSTGAIGVSDHDGFVLQFAFDRIFADGFDQAN